MANIKEKVAYLQGLTKGLNVNETSAEGKLLLNMVDVLYDMADEIQCLHVGQEDHSSAAAFGNSLCVPADFCCSSAILLNSETVNFDFRFNAS